MPYHRHAPIWPQSPLLPSQVVHDAKEIMTLRLHAGRSRIIVQQQFRDRIVRHAKEFAERLVSNPVRKGRVKRTKGCR